MTPAKPRTSEVIAEKSEAVVDLLAEDSLKPRIKERAMAEAKPI